MSETSPLDLRVLVLNKSFQPVRITSARIAFSLLYGDRAFAMDARYEPMDFDEWSSLPAADGPSIATPSSVLRVPRLLLLRDYNKVPRTPLRLSRKNIFLRDGNVCAYCDAREKMTLDHVLPKSRGGPSTWENLVACCRPCNERKGRRTPDEAKMPLRRKPKRPTWNAVVQIAGAGEGVPHWEPFLASVRH
ncbi:MAG: HNH endonuclease [Polyangiales bacterium]